MTTEREAAEAFVRDFPDSGFAKLTLKAALLREEHTARLSKPPIADIIFHSTLELLHEQDARCEEDDTCHRRS